MAEAICIFAHELGLVGLEELLPYEGGETCADLALVGSEHLDGPAMEDAPFDRAALQHRPLRRVELIEPRRQERLNRRWHRDVAVRGVAKEPDHLLDEERIPLGRVADARSQLGR